MSSETIENLKEELKIKSSMVENIKNLHKELKDEVKSLKLNLASRKRKTIIEDEETGKQALKLLLKELGK